MLTFKANIRRGKSSRQCTADLDMHVYYFNVFSWFISNGLGVYLLLIGVYMYMYGYVAMNCWSEWTVECKGLLT